MGISDECGCFKKKSKRWLSTLLICMILFAKLYETKGALMRKPTIQNNNKDNEIKKQRQRLRTFYRDQLISFYSTPTTIEKKKRRKRQPGLRDISVTNKRIVLLQSKTGFFLEILPDGNVRGNMNRTRFTTMELQIITPHLKRIKGVESGKYLAINRNGKVVLQDEPDGEAYFLETISENFDHLFCSVWYPTTYKELPWYLAIRRKKGKKRGVYGKIKRATRTFGGDYSTRFSILNADW